MGKIKGTFNHCKWSKFIGIVGDVHMLSLVGVRCTLVIIWWNYWGYDFLSRANLLNLMLIWLSVTWLLYVNSFNCACDVNLGSRSFIFFGWWEKIKCSFPSFRRKGSLLNNCWMLDGCADIIGVFGWINYWAALSYLVHLDGSVSKPSNQSVW